MAKESIELLAFAIGFPILWIAIAFGLSRHSGWAQLAQAFPLNAKKTGKKFYLQTGGFRPLSTYKQCLTVFVGEDGLAISIMLPWRFFHRPIMIPWHEIAKCHKLKIYRQDAVIVTFNAAPIEAVTLFGQCSHEIERQFRLKQPS